ncbi:cold shock domain-containing protein [Streptomyces sp. NPDC006307]|uniref:cold-shock protein n=1 Tax=Streptomyces sp. NPDC006307 TaxID=3156748 RepID=UPI00339FD59A
MDSDDVLSGHVREWNSEEGWGVLVTPSLPDDVWAHYSVIEAAEAGEAGGFRALTAGQAVTFTVEQAEQDRFRWRAVRVRPSGQGPLEPLEPSEPSEPLPGDGEGTDKPGYSSSLDITFDS